LTVEKSKSGKALERASDSAAKCEGAGNLEELSHEAEELLVARGADWNRFRERRIFDGRAKLKHSTAAWTDGWVAQRVKSSWFSWKRA
jgi:hypothetical protein